MKPSRHEHLEQVLRAEAPGFRAASPRGTGARASEAARSGAPRQRSAPEHAGLRARPWVWGGLAAAAGIVAFLGLRRPGAGLPPASGAGAALGADSGLIVRPLASLLELDLARVESSVREHGPLLARADPLRSEAQNLWLDASRTAQGFMSQLPSPLRGAIVPR